eukprot:CAMPEP_0197525930 /NCGR_PEP_ID=MMETSP1318-20131121/15153_1 /TAXON_ID=552666 /ORGANISM="Partenskyella glossopodia, Strain RCC365" /LENGTH=319 /DNA_ID=CAMNT_0043079779 /DNA_START=101 /DNA_END=1060 /DNA_ORIENTATION=+
MEEGLFSVSGAAPQMMGPPRRKQQRWGELLRLGGMFLMGVMMASLGFLAASTHQLGFGQSAVIGRSAAARQAARMPMGVVMNPNSASSFMRHAASAGAVVAPSAVKSAISSPKIQRNTAMNAALPLVGNPAPDFKATAVFDQEFVDTQLSSYIGKKYVLLFFYPLDFTFVCPTEITAFSDRYDEFKDLNCEILGVSVDSKYTHLAWLQTPRAEGGLGDLAYPLVSDLKREIAEAFGVLSDEGVALRGLFLIDKEGIVQHSTVNNLAFGRNVDEALRVLQAVSYVQENPDEVCPAGWKPGDITMKEDPEGSKEYFSKVFE